MGYNYSMAYHRPRIKASTKNEYSREYHKVLRSKVLSILGGKCARCGFDDPRALQIDHIDGGGVKNIREVHMRTRYLRIIRGFTAGLQVLCANCNWIKRAENGE